MPASSRDPRSFVRPVPLPIPSHKGIVIQARSDRVYNPTVPTREHVRKENYDRRLLQMTQQGFRSVNYKPYQGIGDPFYLDQKKLILHALGQWREGDDDDSSSYTSDNDDNDNMQLYLRKPKSPAKFILKRPRKDLNTLNKEVSHGRNMIRNVRLGHGLFQLIRQERQAKSDRARQEYHKKKQQAMMEWQPPKYDSSSDDETDDELLQDVDLTNLDDYLEDAESRRTKSSMSRPSSRKKRQVPSRPYTPQHAYIGAETTGEISASDYETLKESLFKQLCALHWILEAMNTEAPVAMGPITTCWNFKDLGGVKTTVQKLKRDKLNETKWNAWVSNQSVAKTTKRLSAGRLIGRTPRRGNTFGTLPTHRSSISSSASPSGSTSTLNLQIIQPEPTKIKNTVQGQNMIPEDKEADTAPPADNTATTTAGDEDDDALYKKGLFRFLDEYYDSLSREAAGSGGEENSADAGGLNDRSPSPHSERRKHERKRSSDHDGKRSRSKEIEKHLDQTNEKLSSRQLRAEALIRAKSSPALLEFIASLPSSKWGDLAAELRLRFAEIGEEKALEFHEAIEHLERQRMRVLQNKFINMPTGGSSFHRALEEMRSKTAKMDEEANKKRKASIHQDWYTELLAHIPHDYKLEWQFEKILDKLRRYGLLESGKQSATKFLKVLNALRDWEICCPDIIAAVEFCREKIIEMSIEEFEAWFLHTFPTVVRPQTAPPALKGNEKSADNKDALRPTRVSTSAPVRMRYGRS